MGSGPKLVVAVLIILILSGSPAPVLAVNQDEVMEDQLSALNLREVEVYLKQMQQEVGAYLPAFSLQDVLGMVRGRTGGLDFLAFLRGLARYLFREVVANGNILGKLMVLAVLSAILQNLQNAFESETIANLAQTVCYLLMVMIAITSFSLAVNTGKAIIDTLVGLMLALLPVLLTLLATLGGITSVALMQPVLIFTVNFIGVLIKTVVFPFLFFSAVLDIAGNISDKFKISRFASLLRDASVSLLGLSMCAFMGIVTVYGVAGSVADGVTLRTAKYLTGAFVPVVGGMLSDAVEVVMGCSLILKNAVGIFGLILIFVMAAYPLLKIVSLFLIYKLAGAILQPLGNTRVVDCLNSMGNSLVLVFAAAATVGLMFFMAVTMIIGAGNITVMMR